MNTLLTRRGSILLIDGLDTSKPAEYISDNAASSVQNFLVQRGILVKRGGLSSFGAAISTADEIMAGRQLTREGTKYNVRIGLDKIERYNAGTSAWVDITGTDLTGTTNDLIDTAIPLLSGKRILCITNGVDAIRKWTGTGNTAALGGTPPVAKFIQEYKSYLVCANIAGGVDVATRVQWSDDADPETWSGGNSGSKDLIEEGDEISGLGLFGDFISVHKPTSIYLGSLVSSSAVFRFDRKTVGKGTIANNTIINFPTGEQIFLASDGIRIFNGISAPLLNESLNETIREGLNQAYAFKSWSVMISEKDEVWIGLPIGSQTTPDTIFRYNYVKNKLYQDSRSGITAAWRAVTVEDAKTWGDLSGEWGEQTWNWGDAFFNASFTDIFLSDSAGLTYRVDDSALNDVSASISCLWESKDYQGDEIGIMCRWLELHLWAKGIGNLTVEYSVDRGNTWYEMVDSPYALTADFPDDDSPVIFYFDVVSSKLRVRFRNNSTGSFIGIKQFKILCKQREFRR